MVATTGSPSKLEQKLPLNLNPCKCPFRLNLHTFTHTHISTSTAEEVDEAPFGYPRRRGQYRQQYKTQQFNISESDNKSEKKQTNMNEELVSLFLECCF
jgi:hypothetical protein